MGEIVLRFPVVSQYTHRTSLETGEPEDSICVPYLYHNRSLGWFFTDQLSAAAMLLTQNLPLQVRSSVHTDQCEYTYNLMCINMSYYGILYEIVEKELWSGCCDYPNRQGNSGGPRELPVVDECNSDPETWCAGSVGRVPRTEPAHQVSGSKLHSSATGSPRRPPEFPCRFGQS